MSSPESKLSSFLIEKGAQEIGHDFNKGITLYDHLVGTWKLLNEWKCSTEVCNAGLFHSVYGTRIIDGIPRGETSLGCSRQEIEDVIGKEAEELVHIFCHSDKRDFDFLEMSEPHRSQLLTISYANALDQGDDPNHKHWEKFKPYLLIDND